MTMYSVERQVMPNELILVYIYIYIYHKTNLCFNKAANKHLTIGWKRIRISKSIRTLDPQDFYLQRGLQNRNILSC